MREEICYAPATELARRIRSKELSPVEVVQAHLERIEAINPRLNAIVIFAQDALEQARAAESAVMRGGPLGPLHGVPYTLKDCIDTAGIRATRGSKLFEGFVPQADATVYTRLRQAGGILLGKTNMPEFALWWETDNLVFGRTNNPWNLSRTAGGSSGGEAAAIASGLSPLGVGTDLGGSIRAPAHFCGIVGLKPTIGRVPYTGIWPQALLRAMHPGPMARTVGDAALGLAILAGADGLDPYAPPVPVPNYSLDGPLPELRVGWTSEKGFAPVSKEVQEAVSSAAGVLSERGCLVEEATIEGLVSKDYQAISAAVYLAEAGHALAPLVSGRESELTATIRRRYAPPPDRTLKEYLEAAQEWEALRFEVAEFFTRYDLFLCPSVPLPAFPHNSLELNVEGKTAPGRHTLRATLPWDLTGSPAISVPFGQSAEGLPIGVQLVGRHFEEGMVLRAARVLEEASGGFRRPPVN
jgi:aspartyl-tRNA(Asn)/glutamyl-tRNA(Gln) amidotransferase subunit A